MHDGSDSAYYLAKGFRVIAIEANPTLVAAAELRFANEIAAGLFTVVGKAVADHAGAIDLFVAEHEDLWGSTTHAMAVRGIGSSPTRLTVPCDTLDAILEDCGPIHYVKIDVEGEDPACVKAIGRLPSPPSFVSFEADLTDADEVSQILDWLESFGYGDFKMVNQATHNLVQLPNPPREGEFVQADFDKHCSGPFGDETPGKWLTREQVQARYEGVLRQQAARIEYSASGKLAGVPMGWAHRPMLWLYNLAPVTHLRHDWARRRRVEMGGWFDIHARLSQPS